MWMNKTNIHKIDPPPSMFWWLNRKCRQTELENFIYSLILFITNLLNHPSLMIIGFGIQPLNRVYFHFQDVRFIFIL